MHRSRPPHAALPTGQRCRHAPHQKGQANLSWQHGPAVPLAPDFDCWRRPGSATTAQGPEGAAFCAPKVRGDVRRDRPGTMQGGAQYSTCVAQTRGNEFHLPLAQSWLGERTPSHQLERTVTRAATASAMSSGMWGRRFPMFGPVVRRGEAEGRATSRARGRSDDPTIKCDGVVVEVNATGGWLGWGRLSSWVGEDRFYETCGFGQAQSRITITAASQIILPAIYPS